MIRLVGRNELAECAGVIRNSFMTVAEELGITQENAPGYTAFSVTEEKLAEQAADEDRLMAAYFSESGRIIGYYSLLFQGNGECELNNLCVLPQYRHSNTGSALLDDSFARAKEAGCRKMNIGIVEENTVLREWYESKGFIHTGTKKFDFFPFTCGYMERKL